MSPREKPLASSPFTSAASISSPAALGWMDLGRLWKLPRHLALLNRLLLQVAAGQTKRLLVTLPPRHGKSMLLSQYFPPWYLGIFPTKRIILASYAADFASNWGRKGRDLLARWGHLFNVRVRRDSQAADRWELAEYGGGMITAGVGGPITGRGADILIIDDPVKNAKEALSQTIRRSVVDWYGSTAYTRLEPGGSIVLVQTRWHSEDLAGHVLSGESPDREPWLHIDLPAIAGENDPLGRAPGEPLWPERYDRQALEDRRSVLGTIWFSALFQQQPVNRADALIQRGWFELVDAAPAGLKMVRSWDLAATEHRDASDPDYTAGALVGHKDGVTYILDLQHTRSSPLQVEQLVLNTASQDGRNVEIVIEEEGGASGKTLTAMYVRKLQGYRVRGIHPQGDKVLRAHAFIAQAEAGNIKVVRNPKWNKAFLDEMESFPLGKHDDIVDATVQGYNQLTSTKRVLDLL